MNQAQAAQTLAPAFAVGVAVYSRGRIGYVASVKAPDSNVFTLGTGRMERVTEDVEIAFDGQLSSVPGSIALPWRIEAMRMDLPGISPDEVEERRAAIISARQSAAETARLEREAYDARYAAFKLEAAAKMPSDAKAVIVAELHEDASDSMSDYHNHRTVKTVILAWSTHTRDLFPELRKAALNCSETADLADADDKAEHREKYSMGAGFYLKKGWRDSSGWCVKKVRLYDRGADGVPLGEWSLPQAQAPRESAALALAPAGFGIEQHTHTTKGFEMWIVTLADRVERDEYDRLLSAAKALRGWWCRAWNGAPAGFAFKSEAAALAFTGQAGDVTPGEASEAPQATPKAAAAPKAGVGDKLRALADGMQRDIDHKTGDRRTNTPKQQREAQSARLDGYQLQRAQQGLRALADMHDAGTVPADLRGVTTKAAAISLARAEIKSSGGYYDAGHETGNPAKQDAQTLAFWALLKGRGEAERAADDLRRKIEGLKFSNIPGYFPTPAAVVAQMIEAADIPADALVLEPEGGSAAILDAVREAEPSAAFVVYERHHTLRQILEAKGYTLTGDDFMASDTSHKVDRVLMNPPFENGQDMEHVMRAFEHLKPGGRLVAIMSPGPFFRSDRKAAAFREWFDGLGGEKTDLPAGAFKESGTGVSTVIVTVDR